MRYAVLILFSLLAVASASAQKQLKPIKTYLKAANGKEALKKVEELAKDSVCARFPRLYDYGKQAEIILNDAENEKLYLKQAFDTVGFFNSALGIYNYILLCEKEEQRLLAEEGEKMKFHKENGAILRQYYANISAGGRYFYSKQKYAEAMPFFRLYLDTPSQPIWGAGKECTATATYTANAHLYTKCAFLSKDYEEVKTYENITLSDTAKARRVSLEYITLAALERKDTIAYAAYLKKGIEDYPLDNFFFARLADTYAQKSDFSKLLNLADERLRRDSLSLVAMEAKSLAYMNMEKEAEAIAVAEQCISIDSTLSEAYYYAGAGYCNLALKVKMPAAATGKAYSQAVEKQKKYYRQAMPYLEKYRTLSPKEEKKWAPLLYRVYFILNKGKKFEEIENILYHMSN